MEEKRSNKGVLVGMIVLIAAIVGIVALTQSDPAPIQESQTTNDATIEDLSDGQYQVVASDSVVEWEGAKTLVVDWSHMGEVEVESGSLLIEEGRLSGGEFTVDMNSMVVTGDGGAAMKDDAGLIGHLSSSDFFDIDTYPTAKFVITDVAENTDGTYQVTGDMTIKESTNSISFPATVIQSADDTLVAIADIVIDRTEYDVQFGSSAFFDDLGDNVINDEFDLRINLVATNQNS